MPRRRGHRDHEPSYRRRMRRRRIVVASTAIMAIIGVAYVTYDAFSSAREDWWLGVIALLAAVPIVTYLVGRGGSSFDAG